MTESLEQHFHRELSAFYSKMARLKSQGKKEETMKNRETCEFNCPVCWDSELFEGKLDHCVEWKHKEATVIPEPKEAGCEPRKDITNEDIWIGQQWDPKLVMEIQAKTIKEQQATITELEERLACTNKHLPPGKYSWPPIEFKGKYLVYAGSAIYEIAYTHGEIVMSRIKFKDA